MANTPAQHLHRAGRLRITHRSLERRRQLGATRAADVRHEPLQDAEVGVADGAHHDGFVVEVDGAADVEPRVLADQLHVGDPNGVPIERHPDRQAAPGTIGIVGIADRIVEQARVEPVDRGIDDDAVDVGQLTVDADRAAGERGGVGRQPRLKHAHVRVERGVRHAERQLRGHGVVERDLAAARDRQTGGGRFELQGQQLAVDPDVAHHPADAFVADEEVAEGAADVVARPVERAAAVGSEIDESRERQRRLRHHVERLDGDVARVEVEGVGAVPPDEGGAGAAAVALDDLDVVEPHAVAFEADARQRGVERFPVSDAIGDCHRPGAVGPLVLTGHLKLPGERAVEVVLVETEGVLQVGHRTPDDLDVRVDLLAAVAARVTERKAAGGADRRCARGDEHVLDVGVTVLDHRVAADRSPDDVESAHLLAGERPLDARPAEGIEHHAVERAVAADRDRIGARTERRQHPREDAVAVLPVGAGDVKRDSRAVAVERASLELGVGRCRGEPAGADVDEVRLVTIGQHAADRHRLLRGVIAEEIQFPAASNGAARLDRLDRHPRHQRGAGRRGECHLALASALRKAAGRPLEQVPSRRPAGEADSLELQEVGERRQVDVLVCRVQPVGRGHAATAERRHRVFEACRAVEQPRRRVVHLERLGNPPHHAPQIVEAVVVDPGGIAAEVSLELAARA